MSSINKEYIDDLLKYGEHLNLECKESKNELPKSIWSTIHIQRSNLSSKICWYKGKLLQNTWI